MKLTPAEYKLLDGVQSVSSVWCDGYPYEFLKKSVKATARAMCRKGLLDKRRFAKGYVVATALGKRSHARGK